MATKTTRRTVPSPGVLIHVRNGGTGSTVTTKLGNVTVVAPHPSAERVKENVARWSAALKRVSAWLMRPGVFLPTKRGIPRYSVNEHDPQCIIWRLDGQTPRGRVVDGHFVEIK